jgi:hypothetical protein
LGIGVFHQLSEHSSARFELMMQAEHGLGNQPRFWAREPNDTNPSTTGGSGDGYNGVVKIHQDLVIG